MTNTEMRIRRIDQLICAASQICDSDAQEIFNILVQSIARFCDICGGRAALMTSAINALDTGRAVIQAESRGTGDVPS